MTFWPVLILRNLFWLIKMTYFPFLQRISKNGNSVNFSPKPHYFTIKPPLFQYIGNVSTMYDFLAGFSSPESILSNQNDLFSVFATDSCFRCKTGIL